MRDNIFQFRDRTVKINIAGLDFTFDNTPELAAALRDFSNKGTSLVSDITAGKKTEDDAMEYCRSVVDFVLGEGSCLKIFAGRSPDLIDFTDLLNFLSETVKQERAKPVNREQRRATSKKKPR